MYHTLFQHYTLMFLQELQFTGGKRCFCSYLALRDSVGQILAKWHLNRSQFGIRIDHDLASISDHS
ncbi:hypothetical protein, partial [Escherichia coli]|uniref:hypothetical protein n=1 Tax=Escherichia coli TaxID=562 RepID=UPI003CECF83D